MDDAVEILTGTGPIVLSCEHASMRLPEPWAWPAADHWLVGTHWSYDLGIADLVRILSRRTGWPAVLSRFSRLLIDPNRSLESHELFRTDAEGRLVHLNAGVSPSDRKRRIERYYEPYHAALDQVVASAADASLCSMHSFTPIYLGRRRELEIGVLFDKDEDTAREVAQHLADAGWHVRLNEPYSGREGLMFSADEHALAHGRVAIELEFRQDLLLDPNQLERLAVDVESVLSTVLG